jgi:hypothetical protein
MRELSFQQVVNGKLHAVLVTAGNAESGFSLVQIDGKASTSATLSLSVLCPST